MKIGATPANTWFPLKREGRYLIGLGFILILAAAIRFKGVDFGLPYQLHPDEPNLLIAAKWLNEPGGLEELINNPRLYETARSYPPLYLRFLMWERRVLTTLLGSNVPQPLLLLVARMSSVIMSLTAIGAIFLIGNSFHDQLTGLMAAAFLAVNPTFVEYSRYATADMLMTSLVLLALSCAFSALQSGRRLTGYASLTLSLLAFSAKYNALPVLFAAIYSILRGSYSKGKAQFIADTSLVLASISGVFLLLYNRYHMFDTITRLIGPRRGRILERRSFLELPSAGTNWHALLSALDGSLYLVIVAAGLGVILWNRASRREVNLEAMGLALAFIVSFFTMTSLFAFHRIRDFLSVIGIAAAIWALGVRLIFSSLRQYGKFSLRGEQAAALGLAVLLLIPSTLQTISYAFYISQKPTEAILGDWFLANVPDGTKVIMEHSAGVFDVEYGGFPGPKYFQARSVESLLETPIEALKQEGVVYFVANDRAYGGYFSDPENEKFLQKVTLIKKISNEGRPGRNLIIFRGWPIQHPMQVNLGDSVTFLGYDLSSDRIQAGKPLYLTLYWQARQPINIDYTVFTHLLDQNNHILGQKDNPPVGGARPTSGWEEDEIIVDEYAILVNPEAPTGDYQLAVGMYLLETMERLPVLDKNGNIVGDKLLLAEVEVVP